MLSFFHSIFESFKTTKGIFLWSRELMTNKLFSLISFSALEFNGQSIFAHMCDQFSLTSRSHDL